MIKWIFSAIVILSSGTLNAQTCEAKGYLNFNEFKENKPSLLFTCEIEKRSGGDVIMMGGIENYKLRKIKPSTISEQVNNEIWGLVCGDSVFINTNPISNRNGFSKLLGIGYYSYFIGECPISKGLQEKLGFIEPGQSKIMPAGIFSYVLFENGEIKCLTPKGMLDLLQDNEKLYNQYKASHMQYSPSLELKDIYVLFDYLKKYNATKK